MEFHEKLQELRKIRKLTQEELANELFVSRTAISKWESGKGYPNIDSLKAISKFFNVSLDDLLSSEQILDVAEKDYRIKEQRLQDIIFGILDCSTIMLLFLPFFGQTINGTIEEVSLLGLANHEPYIIIPNLIGVGTIVLLGVFTLALQNSENRFWKKFKTKTSLVLSSLMILFFIAELQPYAATLLFILLIIKALLLIKQT